MTESGPESYTELATGMHVRDAKGQFVEASDLVEAFPGGAVARGGSQRDYQGTFNPR